VRGFWVRFARFGSGVTAMHLRSLAETIGPSFPISKKGQYLLSSKVIEELHKPGFIKKSYAIVVRKSSIIYKRKVTNCKIWHLTREI